MAATSRSSCRRPSPPRCASGSSGSDAREADRRLRRRAGRTTWTETGVGIRGKQMRLLSFLAGLAGMFIAAAAAAQTPAPAAQPGAPPPPLEAENSWHLDLTTGGRVTIQLRPD